MARFEPDLVLINGRIYTVEAQNPWVEAIAIHGPTIAAVGSNTEVHSLVGPSTKIIDLRGRLALPGLCDAHIHLYDWSLARLQVILANCNSKDEMLQRIRERAEKAPAGTWLSGRGWNESFWEQPSLPTRDDLDLVTGPEQPALFWRSDMHCAVANSAALAASGITAATLDPDSGIIGRDSNGQPNGLLWELAINLVMAHMPRPTAAELDRALRQAIAQLNALGVTAAHDQRMKDQEEGPQALSAYQRLHRQGLLRLRLNVNVAAHYLPHLSALGLRGGFGDDYLRLGHVKLFADGTMGSKTAWMLTPYKRSGELDYDNLGVCVTPPEQMAAEIREAIGCGLPVSVHAIGDAANRVVLDILEEVADVGPSQYIPNRIEHVQIIHPSDIPRLAAAGITASMQPIHIIDDMHVADQLLGDRAARAYSLRQLADHGAQLAFGSDAPVADTNPFIGFHAAMYRQRPSRMADGPWHEQARLSLEQTIHGYTLGAAIAAGWQQTIGSIRPGKRADVIVLDRNLFDLVAKGVAGREVVDTRVTMTLFDGEIVYQES